MWHNTTMSLIHKSTNNKNAIRVSIDDRCFGSPVNPARARGVSGESTPSGSRGKERRALSRSQTPSGVVCPGVREAPPLPHKWRPSRIWGWRARAPRFSLCHGDRPCGAFDDVTLQTQDVALATGRNRRGLGCPPAPKRRLLPSAQQVRPLGGRQQVVESGTPLENFGIAPEFGKTWPNFF